MATPKKDELRPVGINPRQTMVAMELADLVGDSMMIWGPPGIGKSAIAIEYANKAYPLRKNSEKEIQSLNDIINDEFVSDVERQGARNRLKSLESKLLDQETNFIDFRLSQIEPSDLRGIPIPERVYQDLEGNVLTEASLKKHEEYLAKTVLLWAPPKALDLPRDWKGVILFDEINSAMPIVQAASYQLILDRKVGELVMPAGALIMAAGNYDTDGGVTFPLATPLRDRMTHIEMKPDVEQFIQDYAVPKNVAPEVIAFLKDSPQYFHTLSPSDPSQSGGASPRSWVRISDYIKSGALGEDRELLRTIASGRVGTPIAVVFEEYMNSVGKLPSVDSIMNGDTQKLGNDLDISHYYYISVATTQRATLVFRKFKDKVIDKNEYSKQITNYLKFLDNNFGGNYQDLVILAIRSLANEKVMITKNDVPFFSEFVEKYKELLKKTRNMV